jgi:3,4-dihydroxy 2-butanone 4-phosphate synthase/GTP cyclohydrolase II
VSVLDLLETEATTHSWNISASLEALQAAERGVMVLLNCNQSANDLFAQFAALDAPEPAPKGRAASMDLRSYGIGAQILRALGVGKMTLLASPRKMPSMTGFGLEVVGFQSRPNLK